MRCYIIALYALCAQFTKMQEIHIMQSIINRHLIFQWFFDKVETVSKFFTVVK